jgi:preprotein translocase subunit SecE
MFSRITTYFKETRQEMKKVNWPTRQQTTQSTMLVIVVSIGVALFLGLFDYIYKLILEQFLL